MRVSYLIAACLVAGVCLQPAHAVGNQLDVFADTTCNSTATSTFGTDEYGKCKDGSGQSSMMFCSNYGGATQLMTFVTFTNTGCSRNDVGMAGMVIADTTCQTAPDTVHGVEATCGATARPNSYNRVLFDAASTSCESAASLQEELLAKDGVCIPSIGGHSMLIWCGDRNLAVVSTFTTADCTGAETTTVLEKDNCQPVMVGTSSIGNLKVACDVGQSKNVFTHYTDSTCDGIPSFIALSDNGECVNASDSNPLLSRSVMSFHNDGKVHTAIWDVPDCQGAAAYSNMYAASTCTAGEPSLGATRWNADMDADTIGNPNLKVEHFYSANDCTGDADTDEHDNNGACFNHDATTTSVQAWCSQDKQLGVASLFSATGCGLPNHAQTVDFKSGVCFAVPGTSTESIKVTCGATAATLSALVLALPLLLAAWLRDTA